MTRRKKIIECIVCKRHVVSINSKVRCCKSCYDKLSYKERYEITRYCFNNKLNQRTPRKARESAEHRELKKVGYNFLEELGCKNIQFEYLIYLEGPIADVIGEKDGDLYIIECGGSFRKKLEKEYLITKHIYIFPYGKSSPFLWNHDIEICHSCGQIMSLQKSIQV